MKATTLDSVRRNTTSILLLAATSIAANLMPPGMIGQAEAKSGGGRVQMMAGPAPSKSQNQIVRVDGTRAPPPPISVKEPCKPSPHCRPPHDHTH